MATSGGSQPLPQRPGQTIISARLPPELIELIDQDRATHGLTRTAWLRKVVEARLRTAKLLPRKS
jgi:hypothetical protein